MKQRTRYLAGLATGLALALLPVGKAGAQVMTKDRSDNLADRSVVSQRLTMSASDAQAIEDARTYLAAPVQDDWQAFQWGAQGEWHSFVDMRSGHINFAEGAGIPWIPGRGNRLQMADIAGHMQGKKRIDLAAVESIAREFLPRVASVLGVDPKSLVLNHGRSGQPAPYLWYVDFDMVVNGFAVEGASVVFRVNNGNLIQFGSDNLPALGAKVPPARLNAQQAFAKLGDYLGGFEPGDRFLDRGSFHYFPTNVQNDRFSEGYEPGKGRGIAGVWEFVFKRPGTVGTWRGRIDATNGDVLEFYDINDYASATGGTYQGDRPATEVTLPLPFTNLSTGGFTNSAGLFTATGTPSTTLAGQYVKIVDTCGAISKAADASGNIALGSATGTDCTTPGSGGAGNTHASRTQFYNVNRAKEVGRGWLPTNSWLGAQLTVNVNLNQTCNAYWDGVSTLNFFKSGGGCANTGELPGVSLHEWGHGLDQNDGNGSSADNGTGETYGDFSAALATHASCIGNGFLTSNCGGYGDACNACTGVRDIDYAKHTSNTPETVANFTQTKCPAPSANNPNYVGPCGKDAISRGSSANKREGHCESVPISQALWDLANRDLTGAGLSLGAAWAVTDRLWYLSRSTTTTGFVCNTSTATWTSNGCATGTLFRTLRAVDDDNGNLADGTPHGAAIAAAFNRHGMACTTDTAWNTTFAGCAAPAAPALSIAPGSNSAALTWTGSTGVYDVYRNERGCSAGFVKVANDVSTASYTDTAVANGLTYYYQVVAQPSGNEACGSAPSTCVSVTPAAVVTPDFAISAAPTAVSVVQGNSGTSTVTTTVSGGFSNAVSLTSTGAPAGVTVSFSPASIAAPGSGSSTATFAVAASTAVGTYAITLTGTGGSTTHNATVNLTVTAPATPDFTISASPTSTSIAAGSTGNVTITTAVSGGFSNAVALSATGLPTGVTAAFAPTSIAAPGAGSSTLTLTVASTATAGTSTITVTGTGGTTTHSTTVSLTVTTTGGVTVLTNGVAKTGLAGALNSQTFFSIAVPAGATNLVFTLSGGTGDADMYTRFGSQPTLSTYDCRPYVSGNSESCSVAAPSAGTYYVMLNGYAAYSGVSLLASFTAPGGGGGGTELVTNGGFEGSVSPWVLAGTGSTWSSTASNAHAGSGSLALGGVNSGSGTAYQTITIPSGSTAALSFWLSITTAETTTTTKYDNLYVEVRNTAGTLLTTLASYSNLNKGAYALKGSFSVAAYAGQTVRLQFRGTTDSSLITTFRVDDVSVK